MTREQFKTFYDLETRWYDEDMLGHLNHGTVVAYFEDVDLAWRARLTGWISVSAPKAICRHAFGVTKKTRPFYIEYHIFRNIIWLYVKDIPGAYLWKKVPGLLKQEIIFWKRHLRRGGAKWL